ncbi:hypothetical protein SADUNF_Sadunf09G0046300 [Salix dunnii]|uniref:PHD-type domain-containing protein n=1 Tax=Salix dunnii TaxID=1413687 RepID=A0A835MT24_9ROSI|nr:hypothetical protein SADUNF_Sadunf09G0046300 [Salix dunnii]
MAFHVACPITCRRICFCSLGFPRDLHFTKSKADFLFDVASIDEFLKDPLGIRVSREGTVLVSVPKVLPVPVTVPPTHTLSVVSARGRGGDGGVVEEAVSAQTKRVAIQEQAAATKASPEYFAKKVESGNKEYGSQRQLKLNTITSIHSFSECSLPVASKDIPGEDVGPLCQICFVGDTGGSERVRKKLPCKICGKKYHRSCLKTWAWHRDLFHWSSWTCPSCRTCEVCRKTGDPNKFMFCKRCDSAYHCYCQHPSHKNVSSGPYLCPKHTRCHSCESSVPGNGLSVRWFLGYTCCDACGRLFVKGNYCPVCLKVYRDSESTPMVCCDICQRWVHCHCDGISDEKYLQFQVDGNLQYQCATCRGECYQVKDLEDAIQELWRRRDKADSVLIASLRAAAGLPAQAEIFSISPFSDDDENGPEALRDDFGHSINLSLKGIRGKSPKKNKDHGKKHWNKKYPRKKVSHVASISKTEPHQHDIHAYMHDSDDFKNYDSKSQAKGGSHKSSSPVAGIVNKAKGICSNSLPGGDPKFVDKVMLSNGERASKAVKIKSTKPHDLDSGDDTEKHAGKLKSVKAKKLVINLGARKINVTSPPKSDVQSCQSEQDLKASNRDTVDHSGQTGGLIKFARREGNLIKFGKVKAEASNFNPKSDGGSHSDGYETVPLDHAPVSSAKKSLEVSWAAMRPAGVEVPTLRSEKLSLGKQSEVRPDTHTERNGDSGDIPILHSLPKDPKLSLKLKIKKPNLENQSSLIPLYEEEKSSIRGQRSKRKRTPSLMEKTMYNEDESLPQSHLDSEMIEANWILKKLGKDAIGKRVEVHQPSDNSWLVFVFYSLFFLLGGIKNIHQRVHASYFPKIFMHKGVVSDIVEGTSMLSITLDDGIVKTLELGKHTFRFVLQKQKKSKI